jgi:selenocysteine-specific elongation factor
VKIRGIHIHGSPHSEALAGQRAAVNLGGIDLKDVERGQTLTRRDALEPTRRFDGLLDLLPGARALRHGARVRFHHGTSEIIGRVAISVADVDAADTPSSSTEVRPGGRAYVRVRLEHPTVITRGDRFILRAYSPSVTIGGGRVLDPQPPRGGTRTDGTRRRFRELGVSVESGGDAAAVRLLLDERSELGVSVQSLTSRLGMAPAIRDEVAGRAVSSGRAVCVQDLLIGTAVVDALGARVLDDLGRYHEREPLSDGMAREEARERIFGRASPAVFDHVIARLVGQGRLVATDRLALASHTLALSPDEARARDVIVRLMEDGGLTPPESEALADAARCAPEVVHRVLKLLVRQRTLIRIDALVFHADVLARLKQGVRAAAARGVTTIDVGHFKEQYGITRKYAIPLLEYLDRERVTRRVGQNRVVL